jgi:hypothetical protein
VRVGRVSKEEELVRVQEIAMKLPEPTTIEELLQRYRDSRRRLGLDLVVTPVTIPEPRPVSPDPIVHVPKHMPKDMNDRKRRLDVAEDVLHLILNKWGTRESIRKTSRQLEQDRNEFPERRSRLPREVLKIVEEVSKEQDVPPFAILGRSRTEKVISARHEVYWRVSLLPDKPSVCKIGRIMGVDHSTISHALNNRRK